MCSVTSTKNTDTFDPVSGADLLNIDGLIQDMSTPPAVAVLRMLVAMICGGLIGLDRQCRDGPAGVRTHMLISLAACLFTIVAYELLIIWQSAQGDLGANPLHLIVAITNGVAFLAAGSIITSGGKVRGLTTGASMWLAGASGLACGTGLLVLASSTVILSLVVLWLLRVLVVRMGIKDD